MRGKFITFEGGEGTGKSTQAAMLALRLEALGLRVLLTREPGGSPGAEIIRHVLLSGAAKPLGPQAETLLFAAARDDHVHSAIEPALAAGKWVVCDRFTDSTRVYQGVLSEVDDWFIKGLHRVTVGSLAPDLTLILDVPVEVAIARTARRRGEGEPDRFEAEGADYHRRLREAFLDLAAEEPRRCLMIDTNQSKEMVAKQIWRAVQRRFKPGAGAARSSKRLAS
jgi:dTMP kinase